MPTQEEIDDQLELLAIYRRNLARYLKQQAALSSTYVPPSIANGIEEERNHILQVKGILRGWSVDVNDHPHDSPQFEAGRQQDRAQPVGAPDLPNSIRDAQVQFFQRISTLLWEYHALIAKVAYYKKMEQRSGPHYASKLRDAMMDYEDKLWTIVIVGIQTEISKSHILVSYMVYQKLKSLYKDVLIALDQELVQLLDQSVDTDTWAHFHNEALKGKLVAEIEQTLHMLAEDMNLAQRSA